MRPYLRARRTGVIASLLGSLLLAGCGGGGGGGSSVPTPSAGSGNGGGTATTSDFDNGVFSNPSVFKDFCANPRGGNRPDLLGSTEDENDWLRAWSHDLYLWYDEIQDEDPAAYQTAEYFDLMKTFASTPSGAPKDQFHFTYDTDEWERLSQSGVSAGYGVELAVVRATPPREIVIAFVEPASPAASAGFARGDEIVRIDGVDAVNDGTQAGVDTINAALFPAAAGERHSFELEPVSGATKSVSLISADVTSDPVPVVDVIATGSGPVGYLLFNSHIATAEEALVDAIDTLAAANVTELVLDLRYNGGGFLDIANELAFMIAGPAAAQGRVFDELRFNDKHPSTNPVTGAALAPDFFHTTTQGFTIEAGQALPALNLSRVFVLSGPGTCSASEAIINGLRGIDFEVVMIGEATCGKPYGFYATDNCGTTYFTIQFSGSNDKGFGDYADGFTPRPTPRNGFPADVTGCPVADDFTRELGAQSEERLATALSYIENGSCPTGSSLSTTVSKALPGNRATISTATAVRTTALPGAVKRR
ncbi:MAG: S41 family peptidase [Pseudomonadota bacterium]